MSLMPMFFKVIAQDLRAVRRFPILLQIPAAGYKRNWAALTIPVRGKKTFTTFSDKEGFQLSLDVHQYSPGDITVKTVENVIIIEGTQEKKDDNSYISRHFIRQYLLPKTCDVKEVVSTLSSDGILTVKAPPSQKAIESKERVIPVQQIGEADTKEKDEKAPKEK